MIYIQILNNYDVQVCYSNIGIHLCTPTTINLNEKCDYMDHINLELYWKREYKLDGKLYINKYDSHWKIQAHYIKENTKFSSDIIHKEDTSTIYDGDINDPTDFGLL